MLGCGHAGRGRPGPSPHQSRDQHQERAGGAETRHGEDSISGKSACVRACTCPCCPLLPPVNSSRKTQVENPSSQNKECLGLLLLLSKCLTLTVPQPRAGSGPRSCGSLGKCLQRNEQGRTTAALGWGSCRGDACRASGMEVVPLPCRLKEKSSPLSLFSLRSDFPQQTLFPPVPDTCCKRAQNKTAWLLSNISQYHSVPA